MVDDDDDDDAWHVCCLIGWTVWLERKITSRVKNNPEHGKLSTQVGERHMGDVDTWMMMRIMTVDDCRSDDDDDGC